MLSSVLRGEMAAQASIRITRTLVKMRRFFTADAQVLELGEGTARRSPRSASARLWLPALGG